MAATFADVATTFVALRAYVGLYEANPLAARLIHSIGLEGMLGLRLVAGIGVCWLAARLFTEWRATVALLFATGFWFLVAGSNLYEIVRLRT